MLAFFLCRKVFIVRYKAAALPLVSDAAAVLLCASVCRTLVPFEWN